MGTKQQKSNYFLFDVIFITLITALSFFLISFYLPAQNINVTYPDWMIQAFRIKELELHGITSWTHTWSNGINLWKAYQFVPQFITLGVAKLFNLEITRAMVIMVIFQFVFLRLITYVVARLLKFSPFTALFASLATFSLAYFWKSVGDYSLLFTFSLFPIMIYFWVQYMQRSFQWFYPYLSGLMFYVHPILGMTSIGMWAIAKFFESANIFSRKTLVQFSLFLHSSSLFWAPILFKESYSNSTVYLATKEFLQQSLAPFPYFGLSLVLLILFFIGLVQQFLPLEKKYKWTKILFIFTFLYFLIVYIGTTLSLPSFINQFQFTRGIGLIGIGIIFSVLPLIEFLQKKKSLAIKGLLVALLTLIFTEGLWITSFYSPGVLHATGDPVTTFAKNKHLNVTTQRVWTPTIELSSYYGADQALRFPTSYMAHLESNHLPERLNQLMLYRPLLSQIPLSEVARINDYFKLAGINYVFLDEGSAYVQTFKDKKSGYKSLGRVVTPSGVYEAFEAPGAVRNAVLVADTFTSSLVSFPTNMKFNQVSDQVDLDNKVKAFTNIIYDPANTPLAVRYPTEESLTVSLPAKRKTTTVFINESYDKNWKADFQGREQTIKPVGPNFMAITLDNTKDSGTLSLTHSWPMYYYFLIFAIPAVPVWLLIIPKPNKVKKISYMAL